ncbi:hypothetical protein [uncultured Dialister sp.]|jgi:hypothetical protein|uniref:hypothetical protein n=1 Tax=Dialister sp. TaxID=1955814 RepID=UPI0025D80327|nr:hypothetical protein [uncultured Dialister sp.]
MENSRVTEKDESYLAAKAVDLSHQEARALGLPRYYVEDGFLIEERNGKKKQLKKISRNQMYGS